MDEVLFDPLVRPFMRKWSIVPRGSFQRAIYHTTLIVPKFKFQSVDETFRITMSDEVESSRFVLLPHLGFFVFSF